MTLTKQSATFFAELKPSRRFQYLIAVIHLLATGACLANALPTAIKLGVITLITANFIRLNRNLKSESRQIKYSGKSGWEISTAVGREAVEIVRSSFISTSVIFLHLNNKAPILIF
ncbi:MAG: hypothetical protein IPN42_00120 [Methylococcaceae bacterium]|nr:hypothetical protein [Methylococcaceae bacterium]